MARIAGIDLPKNKRIEVALTYIYGIGPANARLMHRFNSYLAKQRSSGALATLYAQYLVDENTIEMVLGDTLTSSGTGISNSK